MSDARRRAEEADPIRRMLRHLCNVYGCTSYGRTADHGPEDCAWCEAEALLAEEDERGAVAAEIAGLPVHFVAHLPRGRVFMHPDTPKSGARDAWPPPMPSMIPVPIAPAPPDATEHPCGCYAPEGDRCHRHPAPPAADEVREAAEELQRIDNLLARRITLDGLTRVQKIALALRVCEETDPKGAIAARYTAARGGE